MSVLSSKSKEEISRFSSLHDKHHVVIDMVASLIKEKVLDNGFF